jgi:hypothetical protein
MPALRKLEEPEPFSLARIRSWPGSADLLVDRSLVGAGSRLRLDRPVGSMSTVPLRNRRRE